MPRVSREQTAANRQAIEEVSARLFREQGIDGVSVADLMAAAGLTHGGFYGHFESKDALAAVACQHAFAESARRRAHWTRKAPEGGSALQAFTERYLSKRHRDDAGHGCPAVAFAVDVGRQPDTAPVRQRYAEGLRSMAGNVARMMAQAAHDAAPGDPQQGGNQDAAVDAPVTDAALVRMATMIGAVMLARATKGDALSDQILGAARAALAAMPDSSASLPSPVSSALPALPDFSAPSDTSAAPASRTPGADGAH